MLLKTLTTASAYGGYTVDFHRWYFPIYTKAMWSSVPSKVLIYDRRNQKVKVGQDHDQS